MQASPWKPANDGPQFEVKLLKFNGDLRHSWRASVESRSDEMIVLGATARRRWEFDDFTIEEGDRVRQYFPLKDWFYIQEYRDSEGRLKGWYCNIGTPPEVGESTVSTRDLLLDVFVDANHSIRILDQDELEENRTVIADHVLRKIGEASAKIVRMVETRQPPFDS